MNKITRAKTIITLIELMDMIYEELSAEYRRNPEKGVLNSKYLLSNLHKQLGDMLNEIITDHVYIMNTAANDLIKIAEQLKKSEKNVKVKKELAISYLHNVIDIIEDRKNRCEE